MIDLEGPPGELTLILILHLTNMRFRERARLLLSPMAGLSGPSLEPRPQCHPLQPGPCHGHGGALAWGWGSTLLSLQSNLLLKPPPDARFQCLSF